MGDSPTPIYSQPPAIVLAAENIPPSNAVLVTPDDALFMNAWSSIAGFIVRITVRLLAPDGTITVSKYDVTLSGTRVAVPQFFPLADGFIISAVVSGNNNASSGRGQVYAALYLQRAPASTQPYLTQQLCAGYITNHTNLFYPYGPVEYSVAGYGNIRRITGTQPAAGAECAETVPVGAIWRLISFSVLLNTSATVAARNPNIVLDDGTTAFASAGAAAIMAASTGTTLTWAIGLPSIATWATLMSMSLPNGMFLPSGFRIRTLTAAIQAGDQYAAPSYLVEEWLQP